MKIPRNRSAAWMLGVAIALAANLARTSPPNIYPEPERAKSDLAAALHAAPRSHKRIILDFGGNWCPDCHLLDLYLHDQSNRPILEANFILVHINIGRQDENLDVATRYQIPLEKGVPALAVLDEDGKLLFSQQTGQFESMRRMESSAVGDFLARWKRPG